jgi:F0F1-type ATP synthase assembly protein I
MSMEPGNEGKDPRTEKNRKLGTYLQYSGAGLQFLVSILLGIWAGYWLDGQTGLSPWFLVLGALLGFAAGTWVLYRELYGRKR